MGDRVLVTGAGGFIGRQVTAPLLADGYQVHTVSTAPAGEGTHWHRVDLLDAGAVGKLVEEVKPTHLLHLAWYTVPGKYWEAPENEAWLEASENLFRSFADAGGGRIVAAGTCAEYEWRDEVCYAESTPLAPATFYGRCKVELFRRLQALGVQSGVSWSWGRIFHLYGPYEAEGRLVSSLISRLLRGEKAPCSDGEQKRDLLYVKDVADAFRLLVGARHEGACNIASGACVPLKDVFRLIGEKLGRPELIEIGALPRPASDPDVLCADNASLRRLGWRQSYALDVGIDETIAWWKRRLRAL